MSRFGGNAMMFTGMRALSLADILFALLLAVVIGLSIERCIALFKGWRP